MTKLIKSINDYFLKIKGYKTLEESIKIKPPKKSKGGWNEYPKNPQPFTFKVTSKPPVQVPGPPVGELITRILEEDFLNNDPEIKEIIKDAEYRIRYIISLRDITNAHVEDISKHF